MTAAGRPGAERLGLASLLALGVNGTVGVGIFFAPSEVMALVPGAAGALVYAFAALALWPIALVFGRLGSHFAEDGGPYVWARAAFGPTAAFFLGWLTYVSSLLSVAAVVSGIGHQLSHALHLPSARALALVCLVTLACLVALGLRLSALGITLLTTLKLLPLVGLVLVGAWTALAALPHEPLPVALPSGAGRAALLVVFALQGFEVVPVLAGHSQSGAGVRRATLATLAVCTLLYVLLQLVAAHALRAPAADRSAPLSAAAGFYGGPLFMRVVALGQLVSALGIAFGQMVTTPRYLAALGRADGLGLWLGHEHASGTPRRALALTVIAAAALVALGELSSLFVLSSLAVLSQYSAAAASLLRLMAQRVLAPVRSYGMWGGLSLVTSAALVSYASWAELVTTLGVEALGLVLLAWVQRGRRSAHPA
ncbi:MAG TPA: APC family permease [Polyangiales bacterium]